MPLDGLRMRIQLQSFQGHFSDDFQSQRVFHRFFAVWPPGERSMSVDQNGRNLGGIKVFESLHNHIPSLPFVSGEHLLRPHRPGDRYFSVKIICMSGAEAGNSASGLGKGHGVTRMSMNYGTDLFESLKQTSLRL